MLTVSAVASATGYSVQQVRDLERLGVIAASVRAGNGYRQFSKDHIRRASTLRFWEQQGSVRPDRIVTAAGSARRYHLAAIREARITAALRAAGYRIPDVQQAIAAIRDLDDTSRSLDALDARLDAITQRTLALLRAAAPLAQIIQTTQ